MGIEIKNAEVIVRAVKERLEAQKKEFRQAIEDATTEIVVRTKSGKDVNGSSFIPYSPSYAKVRAKLGRNTSPVDLTLTGHMLASLTLTFEESDTKLTGIYKSNDTRVVMPNGGDSPTAAEKVQYNQGTRPFFGLSDEQVKEIKDRVNEAK